MRISDWSSDVCSSDLLATSRFSHQGVTQAPEKLPLDPCHHSAAHASLANPSRATRNQKHDRQSFATDRSGQDDRDDGGSKGGAAPQLRVRQHRAVESCNHARAGGRGRRQDERPEDVSTSTLCRPASARTEGAIFIRRASSRFPAASAVNRDAYMQIGRQTFGTCDVIDTIRLGDCKDLLRALPDASAPLVVSYPPCTTGTVVRPECR